jgi:hypothetical protein
VIDAVGAADRLQAAVTAATDEILASATAPPGPVFVGWVAAVDAATCPARYRAQGEDRWGFPGWSAATAAGAIARAALDRHLEEAERLAVGGAAPLPDPVETVRTWMRATAADARGVAGWVGELRSERDGPTLAATAAAAGRWLAGFVRVLGWPLPERLALLNVSRDDGAAGAAKWWPRKGSPVSVGSGADARIGRVTGAGDHVLVIHRPSAGDDRDLHRRATIEAAAGALAHRVAPAEVLITAGDTAERTRVVVDEALLRAGGEMVVEVVRQRVVAVDRGYDPGDATPSPACRWCDLRTECPPGVAWLTEAGRWRGGLPVLGDDLGDDFGDT